MNEPLLQLLPLRKVDTSTGINQIVGVDSLGHRIKIGDTLLVHPVTTDKYRFDSVRGHLEQNTSSLRIFDGSTGKFDQSAMDHIELNRTCKYDLAQLCEKNEEYWKKLDDYIFDETRLVIRPKAEDWYNNEFPLFKLQGRMTDSVRDDSPIGYISRVKKATDGAYDLDILYPGSKVVQHRQLKVGEVASIGSSGISTISIKKDGKGEHLEIFNISIDHNLNKNIQNEVNIWRLDSENAVVEKLKVDFPWLTRADIYPINSQIPIGQIKSRSTPIDLKRFNRLYGIFHSSLTAKIKQFNEFEEVYLASRNYLRLVELSSFVVKGNKDEATLALMSSKEKTQMVEKFLSRVEEEKKHLNKKRKEKEFQLFGFEIPTKEYSTRMVGGDTIAPKSYLGQFFNKNINLVIDDLLFYKDDPYKKFAEVISHEEGHGFKEGKKLGWNYEELWNEWYSVVYPRFLNGEIPAGDFIYEHAVVEANGIYSKGSVNHGAFELQKAFNELVSMAKSGKAIYRGKKLAPEDIERSAIATFIKKTDKGKINFGIGSLPIVGFAELYDELKFNEGKPILSSIIPRRLRGVKEANAFDYRFSQCTDHMYAQIDKINEAEIDQKGYEDYSVRIKTISQQFYNKI